MISEIYVQRPQLPAFMQAAAVALRRRRTNLAYGTVRMIEKAAFLDKKRQYDPDERFQSTWYRHYKGMFGV